MIDILVTGAAGSIGCALVDKLLNTADYRVLAFDNDEYGLSRLDDGYGKLELCLGDVRDRDRVEQVLPEVHGVFHLAAVKRVEVAKYNVQEAIKTNVLGTINLTELCIKYSPEKFLLISSDKAVATERGIGVYGATKFLAENVVLSAQRITDETKFSVVRFGNVWETRGNVREIWKRQREAGKPITITHPEMKRFFWKMDECVQFILRCFRNMEGGEIFVPKMEERTIMGLAVEMYGKDAYESRVIGVRPGEMLYHKLMTEREREKADEYPWGWKISEY